MEKNLPANAGDLGDAGSIPGLGRSSGGQHGAHSSILAWRIPWTEEPGGLQSIRLQSQTWLKRLSMHKMQLVVTPASLTFRIVRFILLAPRPLPPPLLVQSHRPWPGSPQQPAFGVLLPLLPPLICSPRSRWSVFLICDCITSLPVASVSVHLDLLGPSWVVSPLQSPSVLPACCPPHPHFPTACSVQFSSVAQSCPTLPPHEPQHARPPCLSPTPGATFSLSCTHMFMAVPPVPL